MREIIDQQWELRGQRSEGGQASVWLACNVHDQRWAVVKRFHVREGGETRENVLARFELELERTQVVCEDGGHVPRVLGSGYDRRGNPYLVLELARRGSLADWVQAARTQERHVPRATVVRVLRDVGFTLDLGYALHEYVHRDVKPSNILLTWSGQAWVADWGIAQGPLDETMTQGVLGSPSYLAPERFYQRATHVTDVYSTAVMAYELLCGQLPFSRPRSPYLGAEEANELPPRPSAVRTSLPAEVDSILLRGLARDPHQRWQSVQQMTSALVESLAEWAADDSEDAIVEGIDVLADAHGSGTATTRLVRTLLMPVWPRDAPARYGSDHTDAIRLFDAIFRVLLLISAMVLLFYAWRLIDGPIAWVSDGIADAIRAIVSYFQGFDGPAWLLLGGAMGISFAAYRAGQRRLRTTRVLCSLGGVVAAIAFSLALPALVVPDAYGVAEQRAEVVRELRKERHRWYEHYDRHPDPGAREATGESINHMILRVAHAQANQPGYDRIRIGRHAVREMQRQRHALRAEGQW